MKEYYKVKNEETLRNAVAIFKNGSYRLGKSRNDIKPGDVIYYGSYEQGADREVKQIEWIVLDVKGSKALLISKYALLAKAYNKERMAVTWETCDLRKWLNHEFVQTAFSEKEMKRVEITKIHNPDNEIYGTEGGNSTEDSVFLLSMEEVDRYFESDEARMCVGTDLLYKIDRASTSDNYNKDGRKAVWWWLRSPGLDDISAASVLDVGTLYDYGDFVNLEDGSVRPAFFLNLES